MNIIKELFSGGDFAFGSNDTLTVMNRGSVWVEVARSLN